MAVYFKFKSAKEFNSLPIVGQFISIGNLKERIFDLKHLGRGTDVDLIVSNAHTNEEYTDEDVLIPRYTSVLIRRVPGHPRMRVVANFKGGKRGFRYQPGVAAQHSTINVRSLGYQPEEESEWDYFGDDPYAIVSQGKYVSSSSSIVSQGKYVSSSSSSIVSQGKCVSSSTSSDLTDEDSRLQAILETSALDWSSQNNGPRGRGRMMRGRGSGIGRGLFENRIPPPGYVSQEKYVSLSSSSIVSQGKCISSSSSSDLTDEDSRLQAILETSALDWSSQNNGPRGRGRIMRGRGSGIGRGLFENRIPPPGYVCHRCNISGHFIQHCLTNGDPAYDPKRFKPPTGIPKSMLVTSPDGSYALPGGATAVLQPDEAAFEKAIEGIPTLARAAIVSDKQAERSVQPDELPPSKKQKILKINV